MCPSFVKSFDIVINMEWSKDLIRSDRNLLPHDTPLPSPPLSPLLLPLTLPPSPSPFITSFPGGGNTFCQNENGITMVSG